MVRGPLFIEEGEEIIVSTKDGKYAPMTNKEEKKKQFNKLIKAIRRNPEKGLCQFYEFYAKIITTTAKVICHSTDKVNEVVNNVLIKIWKLSESLGEVNNPEGWIYTITANTAKDAMREHYMLPLDENIVSTKDEIQVIVDRDSFDWMIKDLSEVEQMIMIHKFVSRYTFQDIAEEINKPLTTITSIYYRALEKIKKKLVIIKESAPINKGDVVARVEYYQGNTLLGSVDVLALKAVEKQQYHHALEKIFYQFINIY